MHTCLRRQNCVGTLFLLVAFGLHSLPLFFLGDLIHCVGRYTKKCWNTIPSFYYVIYMLSIDQSPLFKGPKSYNANNTCLLFLFFLVLFPRRYLSYCMYASSVLSLNRSFQGFLLEFVWMTNLRPTPSIPNYKTFWLSRYIIFAMHLDIHYV
jgi:hypothetical protein